MTRFPSLFSIWGASLMLALLFLGGCASKTPPPVIEEVPVSKLSQDKVYKIHFSKFPRYCELSPVEQSVASRIDKEFEYWKNTPYRYAGKSKRGIDCSGFTQVIYKKVFGRSLPRTARSQIKTGTSVSLAHIQPGDLLFFKTKGYVSHVGIYTRNGEFIHASTSQGVISSRLDNPYWKRHFYKARTHWQ